MCTAGACTMFKLPNFCTLGMPVHRTWNMEHRQAVECVLVALRAGDRTMVVSVGLSLAIEQSDVVPWQW
jgi:hypothetical protein